MGRISPSNGGRRKSAVVKRSVRIGGRNVSVTLEDAFWNALKEIAGIKSIRRGDLISIIRREDRRGNLSSAIRLLVLDHYPAQADTRRSAEGRIEKSHPVRSGRP